LHYVSAFFLEKLPFGCVSHALENPGGKCLNTILVYHFFKTEPINSKQSSL